MKYAVEIVPCGIICVAGFIKIGSANQKLIKDAQSYRQNCDGARLLSLFRIREVSQ
jgi:hypothetical protein